MACFACNVPSSTTIFGLWLISTPIRSKSLSGHSVQYTTGPRSMATNPRSDSTIPFARTVRGSISKCTLTTSPFFHLRLMVKYPSASILPSTFTPFTSILYCGRKLSLYSYKLLGTTWLRTHPGIRTFIPHCPALLAPTLIAMSPFQGYSVVCSIVTFLPFTSSVDVLLIKRFTYTLLSFTAYTYPGKEGMNRAMFEGQQAHPNHGWRWC